MNDYLKYRGKCKEMSEALVKSNPKLILVRGYYEDYSWGIQQHWWTKDENGKIHDPTKKQFPSKGKGRYIEFDGVIECAECGKQIQEENAEFHGSYGFCSVRCAGRFVGITC